MEEALPVIFGLGLQRPGSFVDVGVDQDVPPVSIQNREVTVSPCE